MEEQVVAIDPASVHFDRVGLAAVGAGRFDVAIEVECGEHAERVPRAVGIPPLVSGVNSVCSGDGGERVGHSDLVRRRVQHQSVRVVQLPPAMLHVALVPEFRRRRRTPQLDEGGVCAIAKFDQLRVDAGTLQDPAASVTEAVRSCTELQSAGVGQCSGMSPEQMSSDATGPSRLRPVADATAES
jgi:hypothetical protein